MQRLEGAPWWTSKGNVPQPIRESTVVRCITVTRVSMG